MATRHGFNQPARDPAERPSIGSWDLPVKGDLDAIPVSDRMLEIAYGVTHEAMAETVEVDPAEDQQAEVLVTGFPAGMGKDAFSGANHVHTDLV